MEIFTIGSWWNEDDYNSLDSPTKNAYYEKLKQEIRDKLGYEDGYLPAFAPYECVKKDRFVYIRNWLKMNDAYDTYYQALSEWRTETPAPPDGVILCPCGNKQFYIEYGDYECIAVCTQCKTKHSVYSG